MRKAGVLAILCVTFTHLAAQPEARQNGMEDSTAVRSERQVSKKFSAPKPGGGYQYTKGTFVVNVGVSVGLIGYTYYGYLDGSGFLPWTVSGEYSLNEIIGASAYVGLYNRTYYSGEVKSSVVTFGGRLVAHATDLLNDKLKTTLPSKLDLYATLILGYRHNSWSTNDSGTYNTLPGTGSAITFGPAVGARYMFIKNFGVYVELGRGPMGILGTGISGKF